MIVLRRTDSFQRSDMRSMNWWGMVANVCAEPESVDGLEDLGLVSVGREEGLEDLVVHLS